MNPPPSPIATEPETALSRPATPPAPGIEVDTELLLLPDGRILAHHLTPELASLLQTACPADLPITDSLVH